MSKLNELMAQLSPVELDVLSKAAKGEELDLSMIPEERLGFLQDAFGAYETEFAETMPTEFPLQDEAIGLGSAIGGAIDLPLRGLPAGLALGGAELAGAAPKGATKAAVQHLLSTGYMPENTQLLETAGVDVTDNPLGRFAINATDLGTLALGKAGAKAAVKGGQKLFRSAFKRGDFFGRKYGKGKNALSDLALKHRIEGGEEAIVEKAADVLENLYQRQQQILNKASGMGATVDIRKTVAPAIRRARNMGREVNLPNVKTEAREFRKQLSQLARETKPIPSKTIPPPAQQGTLFPDSMVGQQELFSPGAMLQPGKTILKKGKPLPTVADASKVKSQIYQRVGDQGYNSLVQDKKGASLFKGTARALKRQVEKSVNKADPLLGKELRQVNKDLEALLTNRQILESEAGKRVGKFALSSMDAAVLGSGVQNLPIVAAKKIGDISKGSWFKTKGGRALMSKPAQAAAGGTTGGAYSLIQQMMRPDFNYTPQDQGEY